MDLDRYLDQVLDGVMELEQGATGLGASGECQQTYGSEPPNVDIRSQTSPTGDDCPSTQVNTVNFVFALDTDGIQLDTTFELADFDLSVFDCFSSNEVEEPVLLEIVQQPPEIFDFSNPMSTKLKIETANSQSFFFLVISLLQCDEKRYADEADDKKPCQRYKPPSPHALVKAHEKCESNEHKAHVVQLEEKYNEYEYKFEILQTKPFKDNIPNALRLNSEWFINWKCGDSAKDDNGKASKYNRSVPADENSVFLLHYMVFKSEGSSTACKQLVIEHFSNPMRKFTFDRFVGNTKFNKDGGEVAKFRLKGRLKINNMKIVLKTRTWKEQIMPNAIVYKEEARTKDGWYEFTMPKYKGELGTNGEIDCIMKIELLDYNLTYPKSKSQPLKIKYTDRSDLKRSASRAFNEQDAIPSQKSKLSQDLQSQHAANIKEYEENLERDIVKEIPTTRSYIRLMQRLLESVANNNEDLVTAIDKALTLNRKYVDFKATRIKNTIFHDAISGGCFPSLYQYLKRLTLPGLLLGEFNNSNLENPFHYACHRNCPDLINPLLGLGCSLLALNHNDCTPLHVALQYGSMDCVEKFQYMFEEAGPNQHHLPHSLDEVKQLVQVYNNKGLTILHLAVQKQSSLGFVEVLVKFCLRHGIDLVEMCALQDGNTILHMAANRQSRPMYSLILTHVPALQDRINYAGLTADELFLE